MLPQVLEQPVDVETEPVAPLGILDGARESPAMPPIEIGEDRFQ